MNFIAVATLFIVIEGLYSFCSPEDGLAEDTRMCPPFSDANFDQWFPYSTNQTLNFHSSLGATNTLTMAYVNKSPEMITPVSSPCSSNAYFYSTQQNSSNNAYLFSVNYRKTEGEQRNQLSITLYDFMVSDAWLKENNISPSVPTIKNQFLTEVTLGGMAFQNVVELMQDTVSNKKVGVYKIWVARQKGLVAYELYPTLEQFVKQ